MVGVSSTMTFGVLGSDHLSPVLDRAGDSALVMAGRIELAATEADLAMAGLTRDLEYRIRDAEGEVVPESEALGRLIGTRISGSMDEALSSLHPQLLVDADSRPADAEVAALFGRIEALRDARIGVDIPVDDAVAEVGAIHEALADLSATTADPDVQVAADSALFSLDLLRTEVDRLDRDRATIDVDIEAARALGEAEAVHAAVHAIGDDDGPDRAGRRFGALGSVVGRVGTAVVSMATTGGAAMLKLAAGAGAALPLIAGVVGTLADIAPAGAVAATGIVTVVAAAVTLKLAMSGVGDAVTAALDPGTKAEDLTAALDKLAPSARQFVLALHDAAPALHDLQQDVQQNVFNGLATSLRDLGQSALPIVRRSLLDVGSTFNVMGRGVIQTAAAMADDGTLGRALRGATGGLRNLAGIPGMIVGGLGDLAAAAAPTFERMTAAASRGAANISAKLDNAFASGGLSRAIDTAVGVLHQLGTVAGNVGAIVGSVFAAASVSGGGWLGVLGQVTGAMRTAFASPAVQSALGQLFTTMSLLGKTVAPLVAMALGEIAPVLVELGPPAQLLISTLGSALQPVIKALGPPLLAAAGAVGALVTAAAPLLSVVGDLAASVLPILTPALNALNAIFLELQGPVRQTAQALGTALQPVVAGLTVVLGQLVQQGLAVALDILGQLLPVVPQLTPVLIQLGQSVGQILVAAAPLVPQVLLLSTTLLTQLLPAVLPLIPPLADVATALLILATDVIVKVAIPALQKLQDFAGGLLRKLQPAIDAAGAVSRGIAAAFDWVKSRVVGKSLPELVSGSVTILLGLPGRAGAALSSLAGQVGSRASAAGRSMISAIRSGVADAVGWVRGLPGKARSALGDLSTVLYRAGRQLIAGFISGMLTKVKDAGSAAKSVLGKVKNFFPNSPAKEGPFSGAGWTHYSGVAVMDDWAGGMVAGTGTVLSAVGTVAGAAAAAIPDHLAGAGAGISAGVAAAAGSRAPAGPPVTISLQSAGGIVLAKELQRALLELKRVSGVNISLEIA